MGDGGFDPFNILGEIDDQIQQQERNQALNIQVFLGAMEKAIAAALASLGQQLAKAVRTLARAIHHIIDDIIHGRFKHLWDDYQALKKKLEDWYHKHFDWLIEMRRRFDRWYRNTVEPILNTIQRFRKVLAVFRVFHVKWAQKLDDDLAGIEAKIIRNTLVFKQKLNEVISFVDLIFDADGLVRRNWQVASIWAAIVDLRGIFGLPLVRNLTDDEKASADRDANRYQSDVVKTHVALLVNTGLTDDDLQRKAAFSSELSRVSGRGL